MGWGVGHLAQRGPKAKFLMKGPFKGKIISGKPRGSRYKEEQERGGWKVGFVKVGALIIREWVREKGATVERERVQCTAASLDHTWCYNHSWVQCTTARWRKKTNRRELGLVRLISSAPLIGANETIVKFPCLDPPLNRWYHVNRVQDKRGVTELMSFLHIAIDWIIKRKGLT